MNTRDPVDLVFLGRDGGGVDEEVDGVAGVGTPPPLIAPVAAASTATPHHRSRGTAARIGTGLGHPLAGRPGNVGRGGGTTSPDQRLRRRWSGAKLIVHQIATIVATTRTNSAAALLAAFAGFAVVSGLLALVYRRIHTHTRGPLRRVRPGAHDAFAEGAGGCRQIAAAGRGVRLALEVVS